MAQRGAPDDWDPPSVVQVTVESGSRRPGGPGRWPRVIAAAGAVGVIAVLVVSLLGGGASRPRPGHQRAAGRVEAFVAWPQLSTAAPSYQLPPGCLRITRTPQALAGALRRRTSPCWRYGASVTAILRRIHGSWRLALEVSGRSCPPGEAPVTVNAQMGGVPALRAAPGFAVACRAPRAAVTGSARRRPPRPPAR